MTEPWYVRGRCRHTICKTHRQDDSHVRRCLCLGPGLAVVSKHRATWPSRGSNAKGHLSYSTQLSCVHPEWSSCVQSASTRSAMIQVDKRLQTKVFLAGLSVSLADLVMFATLYRALVGFKHKPKYMHLGALYTLTMCAPSQANIPSAQRRDRYPNLFRWFDFMQHTIDPAGHYRRIDIRKPRFQRAPAAPPATPKVS